MTQIMMKITVFLFAALLPLRVEKWYLTPGPSPQGEGGEKRKGNALRNEYMRKPSPERT
jgi:hypothetical protein